MIERARQPGPAIRHTTLLTALTMLLSLASGTTGAAGTAIADGAFTQPLVAAAHPAAVEAGLQVMREGGNALDAAVAVQMVLGVVEPAESGPGGGGFLLYRDAASGRLQVYDGRETAPAAAGADRFTLLGRPVPLWAAVPSGRSVGVPGLVAMLARAHAEHGSRPWNELLEPAIALARDGIPMPERLQRQIAGDPSLRVFADTRRHFRRQWLTGSAERPPQLVNPAMAQSLRTLADRGPRALYEGPLADAIVARAGARRPWPSDLVAADLAGYQARERAPVCGRYRGWRVCGLPPPSSGGIAVLQILGMLEHFDLADSAPDSARVLHLVAEASRLAFADRYLYLGDPDQVAVPVAGLIDPAYLARRAALIDPARALERALPGDPAGPVERPEIEPPTEQETTGTSHFTLLDAHGNLVALTSSLEAPFGSRMMTGGFLLNNQLTDFTFAPRVDGHPHPNAPAPGKRPRSSMAPTLVFSAPLPGPDVPSDPDIPSDPGAGSEPGTARDLAGTPRLLIGSRGGARIIGYVVKTLIGVLDFDLDLQQAIALPNMVHRGEWLELEAGTVLESRADELRALGHRVRIETLTSGLHGVEFTGGGWRGGADPRLDGTARSVSGAMAD